MTKVLSEISNKYVVQRRDSISEEWEDEAFFETEVEANLDLKSQVYRYSRVVELEAEEDD